jgi:hypothetical protein
VIAADDVGGALGEQEGFGIAAKHCKRPEEFWGSPTPGAAWRRQVVAHAASVDAPASGSEPPARTGFFRPTESAVRKAWMASDAAV